MSGGGGSRWFLQIPKLEHLELSKEQYFGPGCRKVLTIFPTPGRGPVRAPGRGVQNGECPAAKGKRGAGTVTRQEESKCLVPVSAPPT